ncbi:MAG TPA: FAD:protein FMN transferase [Chloroflexota bacterium]|nr:FAD:protein FMN transferase [Chloroflexota bacterium]
MKQLTSQRLENIMGMPIIIDVRDPDVDHEALDEAFDWLRRVDAVFSTYKADSQISRLNAGTLDLAGAREDVREVLVRCEALRFATDGYFDARAPHDASDLELPRFRRRLDPSGLVKGWSVDRAGDVLAGYGARNFAIYAGGDILTRGRPGPGEVWRVGIQHPLESGQIAAVVEAVDLAIATSGTYARGQHITDPHTGRPPSGVLSVTIVGPELAMADAYATAAFAMGERGPDWTTGLTPYETMTITSDQRVLKTAGFP